MWEVQVAETALMEELCMPTCTSEPGGYDTLTIAEDPLGSGSIESFGECRQHHGDLLGRGFQAVQGRVASSTERRAAGLTAKRLDPLGLAMLAISDQGM